MHDPTSSRRDLLRLSLSALALVSGAGVITTLAGCGGGGSDSSPTDLTRIAGSIAPSELGGTGLRVLSASDETPAAGTGEFNLLTQRSRAQLVMVEDPDEILRGLAISVPGQALKINARSTAIATIFLTPGIGSVDSNEAASAVAQIQASPRFAEYVKAVAAILPAGGVAALRSNANVETIKAAIIASFGGATAMGRGVTPNAPTIRFTSAWGKGPTTLQTIDVTNGGTRFVRLDVVKLKGENTPLASSIARDAADKPVTALSGATGRSLTSMLRGTDGQPTSSSIRVNLLQPEGVGRVKIYVSSLGTSTNSERGQQPFALGFSELMEPVGWTLLLNFLLPILDLGFSVAGLGKVGSEAFGLVADLYSAVAPINNGKAVFDAWESGDSAAIQDAVFEYVTTALPVAEAVLKKRYGNRIRNIGILNKLVGYLSLPYTAANLFQAIATISTFPSTQSVELRVSDVEVTVK